MTSFKTRAAQFGLIFSVVTALGFQYPSAPLTPYFGTSIWRERDVLRIDESTVLEADADIVVDELVLAAPLYSGGHALRIDAYQITVIGDGKIAAFKDPAPQGPPPRESSSGQQNTSTHGRGSNAPPAFEGFPGADGEQHPGAIVVFASKVVGDLLVDGSGQIGGKGGTGSKGGNGGKGGPGKRGHASCGAFNLWDREERGTNGGPGGQGAAGGRGGSGGRGGAPVPVIAAGGDAASNVRVVTAGGKEGGGGDPGAPGDPGQGGDPGGDNTRNCGTSWLPVRSRVDGGNRGPLGPEQRGDMGKGLNGWAPPDLDPEIQPLPVFARRALPESPGAIKADYPELERARRQLVDAWTQFHFARTFYFLALDTLTLSQSGALSPSLLAEPQAPSSFDALMQGADDDRIKELIDLWKTQFLAATASLSISVDSPLASSREMASRFVELLEAASRRQVGAGQAVGDLVSGALSPLATQMQASLNSATRSCVGFLALKSASLNELSAMTAQYDVPVCDRRPDMTKSENVDKEILLFVRAQVDVPEALRPKVQRTARAETIPERILRSLSPIAEARDFVGAVAQNASVSDSDLAKRNPRRDVLQTEGIGAFSGFPAVQRARTAQEVAQRARALAALLRGIQTP